jgi:hypothetical protein
MIKWIRTSGLSIKNSLSKERGASHQLGQRLFGCCWRRRVDLARRQREVVVVDQDGGTLGDGLCFMLYALCFMVYGLCFIVYGLEFKV